MTGPQQQQCLPQLPRECFEAIVQRLPPNCIPQAIRPLSKELRQHYLSHTKITATGDNFVPKWAMVAAAAAHVPKCDVMSALARRGHLDAMRQLHAQSRTASLVQPSTLRQAAAGGHLNVVRWLMEEQGCRDGSCGEAYTAAAEYAQLHILQYLRARQPPLPCNIHACVAAAHGGHVAILDWLRRDRLGWTSDVAAAAAGAGQLATLRWVVEQGCPLGTRNGNDCAREAAAGGHVDVLRFLGSQNCVLTAGVAEQAAQHGQLQALLWLRQKGCPWDGTCWVAAVRRGHLPVLEALQNGRCPGPPSAISLTLLALVNRQVAALQWLFEHGWPRDASLCTWAAGRGDVDLLQWLRGQGNPWHSGCWVPAVSKGRLAVLEYLLAENCPRDPNVQALVYTGEWSDVKNRLRVLRWLGEHGWPMNGSVCRLAAESGDMAMLQWLRQLQPPCPWPHEGVPLTAVHRAHSHGRVECLQWLLDAGCPWDNRLYKQVQAVPALRHVRFPGLRRSGRRQAA